MCSITSSFPSVTGPAYAPFIMGRYPGSVGLPGLRWFDRSRERARMPGHSRSYVGPEMRFVDRDLYTDSPTIFELARPSIGALSVICRGLKRKERIGRSLPFAARAAITHFRGNVKGWLAIDRSIGETVARRLRRKKIRFAFVALTGIDKTSHAAGHEAPIVGEALRIVDQTVAEIRRDAEADGRWERMSLWVTSDHGHSPVGAHEDLAGLVTEWGYDTLAHPWAFKRSADVAVMVSGNAMAHLYLDLDERSRPWWPALGAKWAELAGNIESRASVDLAILPTGPASCQIRSRSRGFATLEWTRTDYSYCPESGDPLGAGEHISVNDEQAYEVMLDTDYPDALVQIARLVESPRSGDLILSASRDWDFRAKYEPIPHVSSHGALHREHMMVPLLLNRAPPRRPRRTVDIMPSALAALGIAPPPGIDGLSFY